MSRILLKGPILRTDGLARGYVVVDDGIVAEVGWDEGVRGPEIDQVKEGLIIPGFMNMHTHMGDYLARGDLPSSLKDAVLPGGRKYNFLESNPSDVLIRSIGRSIEELAAGIATIFDFREGGLYGLELLEKAIQEGGPGIVALGRPEGDDKPEDILRRSHGFGIPHLSDELEGLRDLAASMGKIFAIHVSEQYREDVGPLIDLHPDLVIHMASGTKEDMALLASEGIPVATCPRSNAAYSIPAPLGEMIDSGLMIGLGTDNSMSSLQDFFREMEYTWFLLRGGDMGGEDAARIVFEMAVGYGMKDAGIWSLLPNFTGWWDPNWPLVGEKANLSVLDMPGYHWILEAPFSYVVRFCSAHNVRYTGPGPF